MTRERDLTTGNITTSLWLFALPLMLGNVMQQLYNLVDTWVVGRYIGDTALAAVGSSYTILTFLTSVIIGLCLGSSAFLSMAYGRRDESAMRNGMFLSFSTTGALSLYLMLVFYLFLDPIIRLLQVPPETFADMHTYLFYVFFGFFATFLYNYFSNVLRGIGNSSIPLLFLAISVVLNVALDIYFVVCLDWGIRGAALATVFAQFVSGIGITCYFLQKFPQYRLSRSDMCWNKENLRSILSLSGCTCLQQSVMNFGILMVQGIVNSFGTAVMAAFAVAVKIDTIAYMPVQDFGNAFSVFVAQNYGAQKPARIRSGVRCALISVAVFCV
ncbi:MATE family efflux transporter, partial [Butyricicoccus sp.]|uniref:MATE family efflux transporter n=1 Tax=Butyricicoccus sp. TaxID=2049021 RepID=UPI003D7D3B71